MAERFDILVRGMSESDALRLLCENTLNVKRPADRYFAATRLGLSTTDASFELLLHAVEKLSVDELYDRITRRKSIEALGRRKDVRAIPTLVGVLKCTDSEAVINAITSLVRIGWQPLSDDIDLLLSLLNGEVTQMRAVIQAHTRLKIINSKSHSVIHELCSHESVLVSGAARAYQARIYGRVDLLDPLIPQLTDLVAGKRRSAVIDLGDAGDESRLADLVRAPVSMSLRAKSFFDIVDTNGSIFISKNQALLEQLLTDNPQCLNLKSEWLCNMNPDEIERSLSHRDEARQYGAALSLMNIDPQLCLEIIDSMQERLWSDYVTHYYLTCIIGLRRFHQKSDLVRAALSETTPQYTKSRIAAAWACLELELYDQMELIYELSNTAFWRPLRWTCQQVMARLVEKQQFNYQP
ncbi:HEAT repeat domain-containing protein [Synechococcus sp. AH-601-N10]|nr:HEAT repeat domain-containing protein [Synechococcus sp. AH-601-N10]